MTPFADGRPAGSDRLEPRLLQEIGKLTDRIRELRRGDAMANQAQIKTIEAQVRSKWEQLRQARAGPAPDGPPGDPRPRRALYD